MKSSDLWNCGQKCTAFLAILTNTRLKASVAIVPFLNQTVLRQQRCAFCAVVFYVFESEFADIRNHLATMRWNSARPVSWCLWCLLRPEIGASYAEQLKELQNAGP